MRAQRGARAARGQRARAERRSPPPRSTRSPFSGPRCRRLTAQPRTCLRDEALLRASSRRVSAHQQGRAERPAPLVAVRPRLVARLAPSLLPLARHAQAHLGHLHRHRLVPLGPGLPPRPSSTARRTLQARLPPLEPSPLARTPRLASPLERSQQQLPVPAPARLPAAPAARTPGHRPRDPAQVARRPLGPPRRPRRAAPPQAPARQGPASRRKGPQGPRRRLHRRRQGRRRWCGGRREERRRRRGARRGGHHARCARRDRRQARKGRPEGVRGPQRHGRQVLQAHRRASPFLSLSCTRPLSLVRQR